MKHPQLDALRDLLPMLAEFVAEAVEDPDSAESAVANRLEEEFGDGANSIQILDDLTNAVKKAVDDL